MVDPLSEAKVAKKSGPILQGKFQLLNYDQFLNEFLLFLQYFLRSLVKTFWYGLNIVLIIEPKCIATVFPNLMFTMYTVKSPLQAETLIEAEF